MAAEELARFSFGPRDRRGLIAGIRTGQLALLASSLLVAVLLARHGGKAAVAGGVGTVVAAVAFGWLPVAGRTAEEWLPVVLRHLLASPARTSPRSPARRRPARTAARRVPARRDPARRAPAARRPTEQLYGSFELVESRAEDGRPLGVVLDRKQGTAVAALAFGSGGFALLDEPERSQRIGAWAGILAACADGSGKVSRLQWLERVVPNPRPPDVLTPPDVADELGADEVVAEEVVVDGDELAPSLVAGRRRARAAYEALLRAERGRLVHELLVVLSVPSARSSRSGLSEVTARVLASELASLERRCRSAGLACEGPLSGGALAEAFRRAGAARPSAGLGCGRPWPELKAVGWSSIQAGSMWHSSYWIAEWPRHEVGSDFLLPLFVHASCRRSLSVVMAPIAPVRAVRAAEQARTAKAADAELRSRHGFASTARSRREEEAVLRREVELAAGHAGYRFSGYLTVSATSPAELADARRRVEQAAALARLELLRLDGEQAESFLCGLPLARGCA